MKAQVGDIVNVRMHVTASDSYGITVVQALHKNQTVGQFGISVNVFTDDIVSIEKTTIKVGDGVRFKGYTKVIGTVKAVADHEIWVLEYDSNSHGTYKAGILERV